MHLEEVATEKISAFRTGVPIFVGFVEAREIDDEVEHPRFFWISRLEHFEQRVARAISNGFLEYAVRGFFENGGERCVVIPLAVSQNELGTAAVEVFENLFRKDRTGRRGFIEDIEGTDLVCVPDIMIEVIRKSPETALRLQRQVLQYCKDMGDRFAILDAPPIGYQVNTPSMQVGTDTIETVVEYRQGLVSAAGALYFPWIRVRPLPQPTDDCVSALVPPCGHVAGIYARTDVAAGVHKAPANEVMEGAVDMEMHVAAEEIARLTEVGVNCLRAFPSRGIRVWGARTLSRRPEWRYVNVRRLILTLVRWIRTNMDDLVFEPNGPPLWERVQRRLNSYCYALFQHDAVQGRTPEEAFFVKCDHETNSPGTQEAGLVVSEVGLAPMIPSEFIVVRITQTITGTMFSVPIGE